MFDLSQEEVHEWSHFYEQRMATCEIGIDDRINFEVLLDVYLSERNVQNYFGTI